MLLLSRLEPCRSQKAPDRLALAVPTATGTGNDGAADCPVRRSRFPAETENLTSLLRKRHPCYRRSDSGAVLVHFRHLKPFPVCHSQSSPLFSSAIILEVGSFRGDRIAIFPGCPHEGQQYKFRADVVVV